MKISRTTALAVCWAVGWLPCAATAQNTDGLRVCRSGSVEMIVGGASAAPTNCSSPRTGVTRVSTAPADSGAQRHPVASVRLDEGAIDRRRILETELQRELTRSDELARQSHTPENVAALTRSRADVAALRQELARVGVSSN